MEHNKTICLPGLYGHLPRFYQTSNDLYGSYLQGCVALGEVLNLSVSQIPHLQNVGVNSSSSKGFSVICYIKHAHYSFSVPSTDTKSVFVK